MAQKRTMYEILCEHCGQKTLKRVKHQRYCDHRCHRDHLMSPSFAPRFFEGRSPAVAYWAGFIIGDGNISRPIVGSTTLTIAVHPRDKAHLDTFRDTIGANHCKIADHHRADGQEIRGLAISHPNLRNGLEMWGVIPNKTYDLRDIPPMWSEPEIAPHMMRGLFDADGHIGIKHDVNGNIRGGRVSICGNPWVMEWVADQFVNLGFYPTRRDINRHLLSDGSSYCTRVISLHRHLDVIRFIPWCGYQNVDLQSLERKQTSAMVIYDWLTERMAIRRCPVCGTMFTPSRSTQIYCQLKCTSMQSARMYRQRQRPSQMVTV